MTFVKPSGMAMRTRVAAAAATVAVGVVAAVMQPALPAGADLTTRCVGVAGPLTVPGDLVVPTGQSCELQGTTVEGDVRVATGANLIAGSATLNGGLLVQVDAYADLTDSTVAGRITLRDAYGLYSETSELGGSVSVRMLDASVAPAFVFTVGSTIAGGLNAQVGEILVSGTTVGGSVSGDRAVYLDVIDSVVGGTLMVSASEQGSLVCDSEVYGSGVFADSGGLMQLGGDSPAATCAGANYWDSDVAINNNTADLWVSDNIIRGDLAGAGNEPGPRGDNNRVRGATSGQFADLQPAGGDPSTYQRGTAVDRQPGLQARVNQRREMALTDAQQAGSVDL